MDSLEISTEFQIIIGQILKIKENILIGYQINLILNQMKIGIILKLIKSLIYVSSLIKNYYDYSLYLALKSIYPNYEWIPWKFHQIPKNYWSNIENQRKYFDWFENKMNFNDKSNWYSITIKEIKNMVDHGLLNYL